MLRVQGMKLLVCALCLVGLASTPDAAGKESRWQLIYSNDEQGISWYIDTKILFSGSDGIMRVWVREIYPGFSHEALNEIDCTDYLYKYVGCTRYNAKRLPEGSCFQDNFYNKWMVIDHE